MSRQHYLMKQYFKFTRLFSEAMVKEVLKGLSENSNINKRVLSYICRSSRPKVFRKKGVLRNFTKFTGKHLCQSLFFNKLIKKETLAQVFFCEFCEISKNTFFYRTYPVAASTFDYLVCCISEILWSISFPIRKKTSKWQVSLYLL